MWNSCALQHEVFLDYGNPYAACRNTSLIFQYHLAEKFLGSTRLLPTNDRQTILIDQWRAATIDQILRYWWCRLRKGLNWQRDTSV